MSPHTSQSISTPAFRHPSAIARLILLVIVGLIAGLLVPATAAFATTPTSPSGMKPITVTAGDTQVLAGGEATISIGASNAVSAGVGDLYNATAVVVLPVGVTFVSAPAPLGTPIIETWVPDASKPTVTAQVLIWENFSDLIAGTDIAASVNVKADDTLYPSGATFPVGAGIYASTNERELPVVTVPAFGAPTVGNAAGASGEIAGGSKNQTTKVTPIQISKGANAVENEVYRGKDRATTFTVTVTGAPQAGTNGITVVDYLPATFTLLDCASCASTQVITKDGKVVTELRWNVGTLAAGQTKTFTYTAWIDTTQETVTGVGAPTRPDADGYDVTNTAVATGSYTGSVAAGTSADVSVTAKATVTVLDLGVVKTSSAPNFTINGEADFTLTVKGSSVTDSGAITLTDVIPDGMCPLVPAGVAISGAPWPTGCPTPGDPASANTVTGDGTMTSVAYGTDGRFTVTFTVNPLPGTDADLSVTYRTYLREDYTSGNQTSSGDSFNNTVTVNGTVTPAPGNTVDTGAVESNNDSGKTLPTEAVTIDKQVWTNADRTPITDAASCSTDGSGWSDAAGPHAVLGDLLCFRINVAIPAGVPARDVLVTDFVPTGTSMVSWAPAAGSTVKADLITGTTTWKLGEKAKDGHFYAAANGTLSLVLVLRVTAAPATTPAVTGNLAKLRYTSTDGTVHSARDAVDFTLAPPVPLQLDKTATPTTVQEGQPVTYTLTVTNKGTAGTATDQDVDLIEVWDALPVGFTCAAVSAAQPAYADCGVATSTATGMDGRTIVRWKIPAPSRAGGVLEPQESTTISYTLTMPTPLGVIESQHKNIAAVTRYTVPTTDGRVNPTPAVNNDLRPTSDFGNVVGTPNAPAAQDDATIGVGGVTMTKSATTELDVAGNRGAASGNLPAQATIGEVVTYTYAVTIPAKTTVLSGRLVDVLPVNASDAQKRSNIVIEGAPSLTAPAGVTFDTAASAACAGTVTKITLCADGTVAFPETWTNTSTSAATFTVTLTTRVKDIAGATNPAHLAKLTNTAKFQAKAKATDSARKDFQTASAVVEVVLPSPTVAKTVVTPNPATKAVAGGDVTYKLTAGNTAGYAPLYGWSVADCAPSTLTLKTDPTTGTRGSFTKDPSVTCATGYTGYRWTGDSAPLLGGTTTALNVTFTIPTNAPAGFTYTNTAWTTGKTHPTSSDARTIDSAKKSVNVVTDKPIVTKTVDKADAVEGETVTWTINALIPANTNVYGAALVDTLGADLGNAADAKWDIANASCSWLGATDCAALFQKRGDGVLNGAQQTGYYLGDIVRAPTDRTITVKISTILPNTTKTATYTVTNKAELKWFNTAGAAVDPLPTNPNNSHSSTMTTKVKHPAIAITKLASDDTPQPTQSFTYTLNVKVKPASGDENGKTAHDVVIVDTVPAGIVVTAPGTATWDPAARTLTWRFAELPAGTDLSLQYFAKLAPSTSLTMNGTTKKPDAIQNSAVVTWTSYPKTAENTVHEYRTSTTEDVTPQFPLVNTTKKLTAPASGPVIIGQDATYTVTFTNAGTGDALQFDAVDVLPQGWVYRPNSARVTLPNGAPVAIEPAIAGATLTWADVLTTGALKPGGVVTITLNAYPTSATALIGIGNDVDQTNTATAADVEDLTGATHYTGSNTGDTDFVGSKGTAIAKVHKADLEVTKVLKNGTKAVAGAQAVWTVRVTNHGPDPAAGVKVVDQFTAVPGVTLLPVTTAGWSCTTPASGAVECFRTNQNETLASGASWEFEVVAAIASDVAHDTALTNAAAVSAQTYDPKPDNNDDVVTSKVVTEADLQITKTADATVIAGDTITWTIGVRNAGPSVSRASADKPITITDVLPADVTNVTATAPSGVTCTTGATITCTIASDMAVGSSYTITLVGTVKPSVAAGTKVANTATVAPGSTTDPTPKNDSSTSTTNITTDDRLTIRKALLSPSDPGAKITAGTELTYRVTVTAVGTSDSRGIAVTDVLPQGTSFVSLLTTDDWTNPTVTNGVLRVTATTQIAPGDSLDLEYVLRLDQASNAEDITNEARATSSGNPPTDPVSVTVGVDRKVDLAVTWDTDRRAVVPGAADATTIVATVTNNGPSKAHDGRATITLPLGVTLTETPTITVPGATGPVTCTVSEDQLGRTVISCPTTLNSGASTQVSLKVKVASDVTSDRTVDAYTEATGDTEPGNDTADTVLEVTPRAALSVTKTPSAASVVAGTEMFWTVEVTNNGPSDAQAVTVGDTLPAGLTITGDITTVAGTCTPGTAAFSCDLGTLTPGQTVTITVPTTVASSYAGDPIANTATAASTTIDPNTGEPAEAEGTGTVTVTTESVLSIVKSTTTPAILAGNAATYELVVTNAGPSDATSVTITDVLPAGFTFLTPSATNPWSCSIAGDDTATCVLVDADGAPVTLPARSTAPTLTLVATTPSTQPIGTYTNEATVTSPNAPDASDTADVEVTVQANLTIDKSHAADAVMTAGEQFTWTLTVTNDRGPSTSYATPENPIIIRDVLPAGVTLAADDARCRVVGEESGRQVVECVITRDIPVNQSIATTLLVNVDQAVSGTVTNTASVTPGLTPLPDTDPREDTDEVPVIEVADLTVTKTANASPATAGAPFTWTITVAGDGPSDSNADADHPIVVTDTLPAGVSFTSSDPGICAAVVGVGETKQVVCRITDTIDAGASVSFTLTGTLASDLTAPITNTAAVAPGLTPQPENNDPNGDTSSVTTPVTTAADVQIVKEASGDLVAGAQGTYLLTVTNVGPSDAQDVVVTDVLPSGLSNPVGTSATAGLACSGDATLTCTLATLAAGETATITVTVDIASNVIDTIVNTATVTSTTTDTDPTNNTSTDETDPTTVANLQIEKSHDRDTEFAAGEAFTWTLTVTNEGPSDSVATETAPIVVRDVLPAGITLREDVAAGGVCGVVDVVDDRQVVECEITSTLVDGAAVSLALEVVLDQAVTGDVTNTASVTPGLTPLPDTDPREDDDTPTTLERADLTVVKTANAATVTAGTALSWDLVVTNNGPADSDVTSAKKITITDTLPDGVTYTGFTSVSPDWTCAVEGQIVTCEYAQTLPIGAAPVVTITADVSHAQQTAVVNTAVVTPGTTTDPKPENDSSTSTTELETSADVWVQKSVKTGFTAGSDGVYRMLVGNDGPSTARNVVVSDPLPVGLTYVATDVDGRTCAEAAGTVTCALDAPLAPGDTVELLITVHADATLVSDIENTATVSTTTPDVDPSNNTSTATGTMSTEADLQISKTHEKGVKAHAGMPFTWTITVTNAGPSDSLADDEHPITVRDVLPAGVTLANADACTVTGTEGGRQVVECLITETIADGASVAITLDVNLDQAVTGTIENTASVTPGITVLPDTDPRESTDTVEVVEEANLSVVKTANAASVTAGTKLSWNLQVSNAGPADSDVTGEKKITVTDTLPDGVSYTGFASTSADWSCSVSGQVVTCEYGATLAIGQAPVVTIVATVGSHLRGDVVNTAVVTPGETTDPTPGDDSSTSTTPIETSSDVSIVKATDGLSAGTDGVYTLVVTNAGPSDARDVVVTDTLPAGLTFVSAVGEGWTFDDAVSCALAKPLASGASATITLTVHVASDVTGDVVNTATVTTTTPDRDPSNNTGSVTTPVGAVADLQISKTHDADVSAHAGLLFAWTITVTNNGPADSHADAEHPIVVRDVLPVGVTYAGGDACAVTGSQGGRQVVECPITTTIANGDAVTLTLDVLIDQAVSGSVENTASVTPGLTPLPDTTPRESTDEVPVIERADLSIAKTATTADVVAGTDITWTLQVTNHGPANSDAIAAKPLVVTDTLPDGVTFVSATGAGWTCVATGQDVTCELPTTLAVGDAAPITLTGHVASATLGDVVNTATVTPGLTEQPQDGEPDSSTSTTPVVTSANLMLTKTVADEIVAGETGSYLLTVVNAGPSDARDVVITDTLPDGLTFASASGAGWSCTAAAGVVTCVLDAPLPAGATTAVTLTVNAAANLTGEIVNTATVHSSTFDPTPEDDTDAATGTAASIADLSIRKTAVGATSIGERQSYELVVANAGPSRAERVVVTDAMPAGLNDVQASGDGWSCLIGDDGLVTCVLDGLEPGVTAPVLTVSGLVTPDAYPSIENTATVTSGTSEGPNAGSGEENDPLRDNTSSATVEIPARSFLAVKKTLLTASLVPGAPATYQIVTTNNGLTADPGPVVTSDLLPDALAYVSVTSDRADAVCASADREVSCSVPGLAVGESTTMTVHVRVAADAAGKIVNNAMVKSDTMVNPEPPTDSTDGVVDRDGALSITGMDLGPALPIAVLLILGGAVLLIMRRRSRAS